MQNLEQRPQKKCFAAAPPARCRAPPPIFGGRCAGELRQSTFLRSLYKNPVLKRLHAGFAQTLHTKSLRPDPHPKSFCPNLLRPKHLCPNSFRANLLQLTSTNARKPADPLLETDRSQSLNRKLTIRAVEKLSFLLYNNELLHCLCCRPDFGENTNRTVPRGRSFAAEKSTVFFKNRKRKCPTKARAKSKF